MTLRLFGPTQSRSMTSLIAMETKLRSVCLSLLLLRLWFLALALPPEDLPRFRRCPWVTLCTDELSAPVCELSWGCVWASDLACSFASTSVLANSTARVNVRSSPWLRKDCISLHLVVQTRNSHRDFVLGDQHYSHISASPFNSAAYWETDSPGNRRLLKNFDFSHILFVTGLMCCCISSQISL